MRTSILAGISIAALSFTGLSYSALSFAPDAAAQSLFSSPTTVGQSSALTVDSTRGVLTMAPLLEQVTPAIVSLRVVVAPKQTARPEIDEQSRELFERFFGGVPEGRRPGRARESGGSGVIINSRDGHIITNHHVIDNATDIIVTLEDGREYDAEVIGSDEKTDIAVIKIEAKNLKEIRSAKEDSYRVGDYVIAIGNPFGFSHTVTSGIISGTGRTFGRGDGFEDYIQTDASINPGNSGGALINSKGELIGINTAIISRSGGNNGIGLSVPIDIVNGVKTQLIETGEVRRGRIGISIRDIDQGLEEALDLPNRNGALVNEVTKDSAADKAGLEDGDVIIRFNGDAINNANDIRNAVGLVPPGTRTDVTYLRDGRRINTKITVKAVEEDEETAGADNVDDTIAELERFSGASLTDIPEDIESRGGDEGVYIADVRRLTKAARAGLVPGDIIRKVNRKAVKDLKAFEKIVKASDGPLALSVERNGSNIFLAVR
jgi:Do/DeqQ family serine protease